MARQSSKAAYTKFAPIIMGISRAKHNIESLCSSGVITRNDIETLYRGLFIHMMTEFEHFIEDLFFGLLTNKYKHASCDPVSTRVSIRKLKIAQDVVYGDRGYYDWIPLQKTEKLATVYFRNALPFSKLNPNEKGTISLAFALRNAIAHNSKASQEAVEKKLVNQFSSLRPRELKPVGFLRSLHTGRTNKFDFFISECLSIAHHLTM